MMGRFQVLLVNLGRQTTTVRNISPPVGLLFLAALARTDRRVSVRVIDQRAENCPLDSIVDRARSPQPDLVGLRCLTPDAHLLKQAVDAFRAAVPQARILVGGPHASALGARILEDVAADAAVIGEGERSFQLIIEAAIAGTSTFESVPGLVWRDAAGDIVSNPGLPPVVEDLDSLPFPAYDLVDVSLYWRTHNMSMIPRRKYLALFTSRGCPFQCNYCHDIFGKKFRAHSAERIADEMQHYDKTFGVSDFDILDDVFNLDPLRVIELSDLMRRRGMKTKLSFPNGLRTDILSADIVDALAAMGTNYAALALETGSPRLQEKIGKRLNIPKYLEGVKMIANRRIFSLGFVMMGFPTETEAELQATIDVACQSKLHAALFFAVTPFPTTRLYDEVAQTQPAKLRCLEYEGTDYVNNMAINLSCVSDQMLVDYIRKAYRKFYGDPVRVARILWDFPRLFQLPIMLPGVLRLGRKSAMHEPDTILNR